MPQVGVGGSPLTPLPRCQKGSESLHFPHSPMQGDAGCSTEGHPIDPCTLGRLPTGSLDHAEGIPFPPVRPLVALGGESRLRPAWDTPAIWGSGQKREPNSTGHLPWPDLGTLPSWHELRLNPVNPLSNTEAWPLRSHLSEEKLPTTHLVTGAPACPCGSAANLKQSRVQLTPGVSPSYPTSPHPIDCWKASVPGSQGIGPHC